MDKETPTPAQARQSITVAQRTIWNTERDDLINDDIWYSWFWLDENLIAAGCEKGSCRKNRVRGGSTPGA